MSDVVERDAFDVRRSIAADDLLRPFNEAGVIAAADVHVARRLGAIAGADADPRVALAAALAVRAPRLGHVLVDLATIRQTAAVDADEPVDLSSLPWPGVEDWLRVVAGSPLVGVGDDDPVARPLHLAGSWLYLDRYWREERQVAADLRARSSSEAPGVAVDVLHDGIVRLFSTGEDDRLQRLAAATAVLRRFAVVAGGPGTGKTTTVARIVALLFERAAAVAAPPPLIALAAPTGKAAARLEEAVHQEAGKLRVEPGIRDALRALSASTLHRLLGRRPGSTSRFKHHRGNRLPHDVVIVDETSMVSLSLMARLAEAVRPDARLVLVGDPGQLTSIEAGAVLGDIVGPAADEPRLSRAAAERLSRATGDDVPPTAGPASDGIVVLTHVHRYGGAIARLADAIRRGDADAAMAVLSSGADDVEWVAVDADEAPVAAIRDPAVAAARAVIAAAQDGDAARALQALGAFRLLCAHRRGPYGVASWQARIESWLADHHPEIRAGTRWYVGRPLLVTENDYGLRLYNGDTGVVVAGPSGRPLAAFERGGEIVHVSPSRLGAVETVHAMTVHKSQGSQFATAALLVPDEDSPILTRELLYTAATRARERVIVVGSEAALRAAALRPAARSSGLRLDD